MLIISRNLADPRLHADLARFWEARRLKQMQNVASDAKRSCPGDVHTYRMLYEALLGSLSGSTGARPIRSPLRLPKPLACSALIGAFRAAHTIAENFGFLPYSSIGSCMKHAV